MSDIKEWSTVAAQNNAEPPNGWPENMKRNKVNDCGREGMGATRRWYNDVEWRDWGSFQNVTRTSDTTFTVVGDLTAIYHVGRRLRLEDSSTLYGTITNSVFSTVTTVTVSLDSGVLSAALSAVAVGFAVDQQSIGGGAVVRTVGAGLTQPRNLVVENNSGNPDTQLDISAEEIEVSDGSGKINLPNVSETCAITTSGAGGLEDIETLTGTYSTVGTAVTGIGTAFDTEFQVGDVLRSDTKSESRRITNIASALSMTLESGFSTDVGAGETVKRGGEAPNAWYFPYVIYNDSTSDVSTLLSTQPDTPNNPPAGYTFFRRVSAVRNDGSGNFRLYSQNGNFPLYLSGYGFSPLTPTSSWVAQSFSSLVPSISTKVYIWIRWTIKHSVAQIPFTLNIRPTGASTNTQPISSAYSQVANAFITPAREVWTKTDNSQSIDFQLLGATPDTNNALSFSIAGYELPI